ncbi:hypothetical protein GIB67_020151 [Kingdonia uniflora]|uniref:RNase H type-1 domain-containing protein n=1 Tax=Kingdonia uniflora TaxID=39325 RepID=A0A7J7NIX4_9MAGN|nr:hypothetical protein GIB67_020151 [Kingdonia uniflora]
MTEQELPLEGILVYLKQIKKGLKLPLRADQKKFLNFYDVAPGQFNPNNPQIGEIKINTDGAAKGNPGKGGIGCIFCDSNGNVLGTLLKGFGLVTNYMAECEAIIHGVEYAASFGWLIAWIELYSTTAVEAFKSDNIPWILEAAWENARRNMRHIRFLANWREDNFSADALSKRGALLHEGMCETEMGKPAFLKKIDAKVARSGTSSTPKSTTLVQQKASIGKKSFPNKLKTKVVRNLGDFDDEAQHTIESYAAGTITLEEEFADYLVGVESLSIFFIEGHRTMNNVRNFHALFRLTKLLPQSRTHIMTIMQIKKLLVDGKPRLLGTEVLASQLLVYKNIEKELIKENDELVQEKESLEAKLEKLKLRVVKSKETVVRKEMKAWEMEKKKEADKIRGNLAKEREEALAMQKFNFEDNVQEKILSTRRSMEVENAKIIAEAKAKVDRINLNFLKPGAIFVDSDAEEEEVLDDQEVAPTLAGGAEQVRGELLDELTPGLPVKVTTPIISPEN